MVKLKPTLHVYPAAVSWFNEVSFLWSDDPWFEELKATIKAYPGVAWAPASKRWLVPVELILQVQAKALELGLELR